MPKMDTKNNNNFYNKDYEIPGEVVKFVGFMKKLFDTKNVEELQLAYNQGFADINDKYYSEKAWPHPSSIEKIIPESKSNFMIVYKEIYYRDIYHKNPKKSLPLNVQCESFSNFKDFFALLLNTEENEPANFVLPGNWIWDIIEGFINQYVSFCHYKTNPSLRNSEENKELEEIEKNQNSWDIYTVLNILYSLISKAQIHEQLKAIKEGNNPDDFADVFGKNHLYFKVGYFSMIGLLRLQVHLSDYHEALESIRYLNIEPKGLFSTVPNCYVTVHYYIAFCHMMMRNYCEAIKIFEISSLYIQKITNMYALQHPSNVKKNKELDFIGKFHEKILILLAICLTITPQTVEDSVKTLFLDKYDEAFTRMSNGEISEFEKSFILGAPKFVSPNSVTYENNSISRQALQRQCSAFISGMKGQIWTPVVRSYLKLYNSLSVDKLAHLMNITSEETIPKLLIYKKSTTSLGKFSETLKNTDDDDLTLDLNFYIDNETINIADTRVTRNVSDYFLKSSLKFKALTDKAKAINLTGKCHSKKK
uniref:Eukaryotic translation initiation factor 3 subunit L n=1 Tax=Parastrongyloides trichosuri TaxID=131310 RepID=A0A0N4ZJG1_PARTI